jgi:DnaJ-domain-containing protein 1
MVINKEIIIRLLISLIFIGIAARVLVPLFLDKLKGKSLGLSKSNDIDYLIKRQKEILKSQTSPSNSKNSNVSSLGSELQQLKNEISWGGSELSKDLKNKINSLFSYQFSDTKITNFLNMIDRKNFYTYLKSSTNKIEKESIINYLTCLYVLTEIIHEIREKDLSFTIKCAHKIKLIEYELALAIQLKILYNMNSNVKEERIFVESFILHQYSEETLFASIENIVKKEAMIWQKSVSLFFEELSLYTSYASILVPIERPKHKKDIITALKVFNADDSTPIEEIKKQYKKYAQLYHPDKIIPKKLPISLEKKAILKFNIIKESFEILSNRIKNE